MKIVFLIGNGFDINCGLKSAYKDMYKGYVATPSHGSLIGGFKSNINRDIDTWADFEVEMAKYGATLKSQEEVLTCVRDFKHYIKDYLETEDASFAKRLSEIGHREILDELNNSLHRFYEDCGVSENIIREIRNALGRNDYSFILFNYTTILEQLLSLQQKDNIYYNSPVVHIHGTLERGDMALGIDNLGQFTGAFETDNSFKRGFVKTAYNEEYNLSRVERAKAKIADADIICTFGMSLGETDLTWRNEIIKSLSSSDDKLLFVFDYKKSSMSNLFVEEKMDEMDAAKKDLCGQWGISANDKIVERIFIPIGKNIFNFGKIIEKELQKKPVGVTPVDGIELVHPSSI